MCDIYSFPLLTGNHTESRVRIKQFIEFVKRKGCSGSIACKSGRYPMVKQFLDTIELDGLNVCIRPISTRADFTFFLTTTDILFIEDTAELTFLLDRGWLKLPITLKVQTN